MEPLTISPDSLAAALRQRTSALHIEAERSGFVADMLRGAVDRRSYALFLRNLLPAYRALERGLQAHAKAPVLQYLVRPELFRSDALEMDLKALAGEDWDTGLPTLPTAVNYSDRITFAAGEDGSLLIGHAYARYLGDLSGGQILKRLLAQNLDLDGDALRFYEFPAIADVAAYKLDYRKAIDRAGAALDDFSGIVSEGALAFGLNIALSQDVKAYYSADSAEATGGNEP